MARMLSRDGAVIDDFTAVVNRHAAWVSCLRLLRIGIGIDYILLRDRRCRRQLRDLFELEDFRVLCSHHLVLIL